MEHSSGLNIDMAAMSVFLFVMFYLWAMYKQTYWARRGVHTPPGTHWLFGHLKDSVLLRASSSRVLCDLYKHPSNSGQPVVGGYVMQQPFLLMRSPILIRQLLVNDFHLFSNRNLTSERKSDAIGSSNLLGIHNPQWKYLRLKLQAAFGNDAQKAMLPVMVRNAENMKRFLEERVPASGEKANVDVRDISTRYIVDVLSSFSFGIRSNSFQTPDTEFYTQSRKLFKQGLYSALMTIIDILFPFIIDFFQVSVLNNPNYFRKIFWKSMNKREKSGAKRDDVIDCLLHYKNEPQDDLFEFEGDKLVAQSISFFMAGQETSAMPIGFALLELARHPEMQRKVREELRENIGEEGITSEIFNKIPYLSQVVAETLRLYPPTALLDRTANKNYKLPGTDIVIEKGTVVFITLKGLHEDPAFHPNPLTFDPERFSDERRKDMQYGTYMPFGAGPRICIGMRIGLMQIKVALITILRNYEVSINRDFQDDVSRISVFTIPDYGINLYFSKL